MRKGIKNTEKKSRIIIWLPVIASILLVSYCRYRMNFYQPTINGDGAYFALQVKSILTHFKLALPDMPLYFYFTALFTKILIWLHIAGSDHAIILAIKIIDIVIPALSAICVFLLAKKLAGKENNLKYSDYLMTAFSVLFFPYMLFLNGELQKDAVGIALIFLCLMSLYFFSVSNKKWPVNLLIILAVGVLVDFGIFVVMLFFILIFALFHAGRIRERLKIQHIRAFIIGGILLIAIFCLSIYLFDPQRARRLISFPLEMISNPVIAFWLNGDRTFDPSNAYIILINLLTLVALILLTIHRKSMNKSQKYFAYSLAVSTLVIASPLLCVEFAWRLYILSFIPVTIVYLIIFKLPLSKITRGIFYCLFSLLLIYSIRVGLVAHRKPQMSKEAFAELHAMKENVKLQDNSVTVTRLFPGWWYALYMDTKVCQDYDLTKKDFKKYSAVYLLHQTKGNIPINMNFIDYEDSIPGDATSIYKGKYFELYQLNKNMILKEMPNKAPIIAGEIHNITSDQFSVNDGKLNYIILFNALKHNLKDGDRVKIWGERKPLSIKVTATAVVKI